MRLKLFGVTVLSLGILAGACANASTGDGPGDGGTGPGTGATGPTSPTGPTGPGPTGPGQLVLRIEQGGGFVAIQYNLTRMPMLSLYDDGLLVTPGAQIEIYPGPALPALSQQHLSPDAIRLLIQAAIDVGLDKDRDYTDLGSTMISDAPTTTFTLTIDGQTHTTQVYALDFDLGPAPDRMSKEELQARKDLQAFQAKASDLSWLPDGSVTDQGLYQPTALRIFSSPYQPDPELTQAPIAWPLTPGLDLFGDSEQSTPGGMRCGTVADDETASLLSLAEQANQLTPWTSDGTRYGLLFRPLLPDESGC
ncbi:MAG: hypothetical protein ABI595_01845 [Actinomycetota bacterium]